MEFTVPWQISTLIQSCSCRPEEITESVTWYSETLPVGTLHISCVGRVLLRHQSDAVNLYANHIHELTISIIDFFHVMKSGKSSSALNPINLIDFYLLVNRQTLWNPLLAFCTPKSYGNCSLFLLTLAAWFFFDEPQIQVFHPGKTDLLSQNF